MAISAANSWTGADTASRAGALDQRFALDVQGVDALRRTVRNSPEEGLRQVSRQFEAMFMTEMLRLARPPSHAAGRFATSHAEKSWQIFMDQALGEAATTKGGTGLTGEIEKALRAAQGARSNGTSR